LRCQRLGDLDCEKWGKKSEFQQQPVELKMCLLRGAAGGGRRAAGGSLVALPCTSMHFSAIRAQRRHPAFSRFKMPCCDIAVVAAMAGIILGAVCFESPPSATPHVELPATLVSVSSAHFHFLAVDGSGRLYR